MAAFHRVMQDRQFSMPKSYKDISRLIHDRLHVNHTHTSSNKTIIMMEFKDIPNDPKHNLQSQLQLLQTSVSFLLQQNTTSEIILSITSQGGPVSEYGLASYTLSTLKHKHNVTIFIDTVAASGGYLLACQGSKLYATPSSIVGSIGVLGQSINFYNLLEKMGVYNKVFRSGEAKSPVMPLGQISDGGEEVMQRMIDRVHVYFKGVVQQKRYNVALDEVFSGDVFLGEEALKYNLIDGIMSSEEYVTQKIMEGYRILKIVPLERHRHAFFPFSVGLWRGSIQFMTRLIGDFRRIYLEA